MRFGLRFAAKHRLGPIVYWRPLQGAVGIKGSPAVCNPQVGFHLVHVLLKASQQTKALSEVVFSQGQVEILEGQRQGVVIVHVWLSIKTSLWIYTFEMIQQL